MQKKMSNTALLNRVFKQVPIDDILARAEQELGLVSKEPEPLKVGDKVRILPRQPGWENEGPKYTEEMLDHTGHEYIVADVFSPGWIRLRGNRWSWMTHWLEKVEE